MPTESDLATFFNRVPADGSTIGNGALRDALKWEPERYDAVLEALLDQGRLEKGRGRGGTVRRCSIRSANAPAKASATIKSSTGPLTRLTQFAQAKAKLQPHARVAPIGVVKSVVKAPPKTGNIMFEQTFKNIDDILHKDAGCTSELDYTEQSSWLLFLKYLDALEQDKATEAALEGKPYTFFLDKPYRWESWAAPKGADGKVDHNTAMTGDDLRDFVNHKLCPYLQGFKQRATGPNTIEYKIGEIFSEIKNKIQSGYNLRDVVEHIDELRFGSQSEKHELSHLYEAKIKNMGNAGRNGANTTRPVRSSAPSSRWSNRRSASVSTMAPWDRQGSCVKRSTT